MDAMAKRKIFLKFAVILPLLLTLGLSAQNTLSGRVTGGKDSIPLTGAHIMIDNGKKSAVTSSDGTFVIKGITTGKNDLKVTFLGYSTYTSRITINETLFLKIHLDAKPVMEDEFVVTATRASQRTPATYVNIEKKEIESLNLGKDLPFLLETSPSLVATSDAGSGVGYTNVRIRGTDLTRINVTVNGVPLNDPESHGVWFVDLPDFASSIDNIQIQRGVGTSSNGAAAFGASINIQTQKPSAEPYGEIQAAAGSFNTFRQSLNFGTGHINGRWSFDGRLSSIVSDGYVDRASSDLSSMLLSGSYLGIKTIVKTNIIRGKEKTYQAWMGIPPEILDTNRTYNPMGKFIDENGKTRYYENQTDNYFQDHYHLIVNHSFSNRLFLNTTLFYIKGKGYYEEYHDKNIPGSNTSFASYGLENVIAGDDTITQTSLIRQLWLDNHFYGFVYSLKYESRNKLEAVFGGGYNQYTGDHFGKIIWSEYASNGSIDRKWYENTGEKTDFNVYGKMSIPIREKYYIYLDIQYRHINYSIEGIDKDFRALDQQHTYDFFNPKLGASILFNDRQKAYMSLAVSNREPNRYNFTDTDPGRPAPVHETLYNLEAGYNAGFSDLSLGVNVFLMNYRNQLVLTGRINDVGSPVMENVPHSYRAGLEITTEWIVSASVDWKANVTLSENRIRNFSDHVVDFNTWPYEYVVNSHSNTNIAFSPSVTASSELIYIPFERLSLSLVSKYVGRQYIDNTSSEERKLDPWFLNDIIIRYGFQPGFMKKLDLTLRLNNIFNTEYESNAWVYRYYADGMYYEDSGYFPQAGFHFLAGMNLKF